jgi:hypothetical protein
VRQVNDESNITANCESAIALLGLLIELHADSKRRITAQSASGRKNDNFASDQFGLSADAVEIVDCGF